MICVTKSSLKKLISSLKLTLLLSEKLIFFLEQKNILFSETYFLEIPQNLIIPAFFFAKADTKKDRYASAKTSKAALVKLRY